ncbi:hypothetical protein AAES_61773 [Amazona aestiva]|uniref:Uncharacterized protein n=1 Tax=Amazona aestiva TaxID=12930 RepID=A0A0Q3TRL2_AMAAE|nr:hypothetical protein AAES_61773 [Amazona aestiva]
MSRGGTSAGTCSSGSKSYQQVLRAAACDTSTSCTLCQYQRNSHQQRMQRPPTACLECCSAVPHLQQRHQSCVVEEQ